MTYLDDATPLGRDYEDDPYMAARRRVDQALGRVAPLGGSPGPVQLPSQPQALGRQMPTAAAPQQPRDLSTPVRWMMGRDLQGNFAPTAHARNQQGRNVRLYNPEEIERAGGYQPSAVNPDVGFVGGSGEQLDSIADMVDELNKRNPYQLAYMDRGGIRITRPLSRARSPQELQAGLGAIEAAKEQNRGLTFSGMEASYRDALATGNNQLARRIAERMYRLGAPPQTLRDIANEVQEASKPLATPQMSEDEIWALHNQLLSLHPAQWPALATQLAAAGYKDVASMVMQGANSQIAQQRVRLSAAQGERTAGEKAREFDVNAQLKERGMQATQQQRGVSNQMAAQRLQQSQANAEQTAQDRAATRQLSTQRFLNTMSEQKRSAVNKRAQQVIGRLENLRKHQESEIAHPLSTQEEHEIGMHAIDQAFGDNKDLHDMVRANFDQLVQDKAGPLSAASIAIAAVMGQATAPMAPEPPKASIPEAQAMQDLEQPAGAGGGQLNFGDY